MINKHKLGHWMVSAILLSAIAIMAYFLCGHGIQTRYAQAVVDGVIIAMCLACLMFLRSDYAQRQREQRYRDEKELSQA